jgi:hypothetical protein
VAHIDPQQQRRETELGLVREYFGDGGTSSYVLPTGLETDEFFDEGPFVWRYLGQASFETEPLDHAGG